MGRHDAFDGVQVKRRKLKRKPIVRDLLARDQCEVLRDAVIAICEKIGALENKVGKGKGKELKQIHEMLQAVVAQLRFLTISILDHMKVPASDNTDQSTRVKTSVD